MCVKGQFKKVIALHLTMGLQTQRMVNKHVLMNKKII